MTTTAPTTTAPTATAHATVSPTDGPRTGPIVVLGATGKTGGRVAERLAALGHVVRAGSRTTELPFAWDDRSTWAPVLSGARAVYISYYPDLCVPGATADIAELCRLAVAAGVERLALLSGRGEIEAEAAERIVQATPIESTILRASWFAQNFTESYLLEPVLEGVIALPAGDVPEPFVDADDIADVAVAALTEPGHAGQVYELTGPRSLTFAEVAAEIGAATGRDITFVPVSIDDYAAGARAAGVPDDVIELLRYLFTTVLDGRNAGVRNGVTRALGRPARDFDDFARAAAATGIWSPGALVE